LSFRLDWLSPILLLIGVVLFMVSDARKPRQFGRIVIGLGLMLLALKLIVAASIPLQASPALRAILMTLGDDPILAMLLAAALTWLIHAAVGDCHA
jgi:phosphate:Na+ symporter